MTLRPFEQIVECHGPAILRVCRAGIDGVDAEEAWSETFLAALRTYPDLDEDTNIEAWLVTIAKNKIRDVYRARMRRPEPVVDVPESGIETPETDDELWSALRSLPDTQRDAISYHHLGGVPYADVAQILGNSEAAARRAAADGMKTLRKQYKGAVQ